MKTIFAVAFVLLAATSAQAWTGKVLQVRDADAYLIAYETNKIPVKLRFLAPPSGAGYSGPAKALAAAMLAGKTVEVKGTSMDTQGRLLGDVLVNDASMSEKLLEAGFAATRDEECKSALCNPDVQARELANAPPSDLLPAYFLPGTEVAAFDEYFARYTMGALHNGPWLLANRFRFAIKD